MVTSWAQVNADIAGCAKCEISAGITNKVPGQGNPDARLMIIGEGPGAQEDRQGLAFVGAAGQLLTQMLQAIGLSREEVFISNIVKCRPPGNRAPTDEEANNCLPYLRAQTALIRPQAILLLGATALKYILGPELRITKARGQFVPSKGVYILPTFHPAALLRDPGKKRDAWEDLKQLRDKLSWLPEKEKKNNGMAT
ncbi:MAG: uracil-DNA glycosylase [Eubacteriales bacterium]|nr:uracil-DNA glycosylase [Eubacteriales bacterium]